ncbi:MAG: hypothetical protein AB8F65_10045 [Woeseiaceae bacterium]
MTSGFARLFLCIVAGVMAACSTSRTDMSREAPLPVYEGESVVVMARSYHTGNQTERDFTDCVVRGLDAGRDGINIMSGAQFQNEMYPWFEPRTAPVNISALPKLMSNELVAQRMRETGVRYVVWLDGNTDKPNGGGSVSCAAGPGGAGCFGFTWWESVSDYDAVVWDLEDGKEAGNIATEVSGTSYMPAIVIPIPMIARTQATACRDLSVQLKAFIVGDQTP